MSATPAVDALLDEKAIEHLDFQPTCEVRVGIGINILGLISVRLPIVSEPCAEAAAGVETCRMCGYAMTCCEAHRAEIDESKYLRCGICYSPGSGANLFHFTPWPGA